MKTKRIWAIMIFLAAAIAVLALLNRPAVDTDAEVLSLVAEGQVLRVYTYGELKELPCVEVEKEIRSAGFKSKEGLWRGVPLRTIFADAGIDLSSYKQVVTRADDSFVSAFSVEEVLADDNIFIAYSFNGHDIGGQEDGGDGPLRIVISKDIFGTRSTRWLYQLELQR
ncbi:MAG: molybdopterin-dependent oxidoreductase [Bacillota bacterium]|nr:molybdopterin-dependent oxidoreductase [Bacillota bacterium]